MYLDIHKYIESQKLKEKFFFAAETHIRVIYQRDIESLYENLSFELLEYSRT